ncbi:MAG: glycosyltransferase family 2 protein [Firmicutes bacterium]|nr:glycosyltransferase family 2 protein [Bacillota bacterium]
MKMCSVVIAVTDGLARNQFFFSRLFRNTDHPFELIIIDNGTTDGTGSYLNELPNRKLIRFPVNMGLGKAWNSALRVASGSILAFVETGCVLPAKWLSTLVGMAGANRRARVVRTLDRETVLRHRSLFGRYADLIKNVPGTAFSSEAELNSYYPGGFDEYATRLARRFKTVKLPSSTSDCLVVAKEVFQSGFRFPEGYAQAGQVTIDGFTASLQKSGAVLKTLISGVYTHR